MPTGIWGENNDKLQTIVQKSCNLRTDTEHTNYTSIHVFSCMTEEKHFKIETCYLQIGRLDFKSETAQNSPAELAVTHSNSHLRLDHIVLY